jgi:hypothetical protein
MGVFIVNIANSNSFWSLTVLVIFYRPVFYLYYNVSENVFRLCLQVKNTQLGPIDRASVCLRGKRVSLSSRPNWIASTWRRRQNQVSETLYFNQDKRLWIMSRIVIVLLIDHSHKAIDLSYRLRSRSSSVFVCVCVYLCWCGRILRIEDRLSPPAQYLT